MHNVQDYSFLYENAAHPTSVSTVCLVICEGLHLLICGKRLHDQIISPRGVRVMVFNATFNNISVMSWRSVLLVEETGVPEENH